MLRNRTRKDMRLCVSATALMISFAAFSPALGQSTASTPASTGTKSSETREIETVIVTAQQRTQSIKDVPLAITALGATQLRETKIRDFGDLATITPGFVSSPNYGFILYSSIRGISSNEFGFATDPSIAMYVDGVYQGLSGSQVNAFYDVERVEVVNGPQSTLYGRSSIAGAINVLSAKPGKTFGGYANFSAGERGRIAFDGGVDLPISEAWSARLSAKSEKEDGYIKNLAGGDDLSPVDIRAGRAQLAYDNGGALSANVKLNFEEREQSGNIYQSLGLSGFTVNLNPQGRENYANYKMFDAVLDGTWKFSETLSLYSNTSFRRVWNEYQEKFDALPQIVGGPYFQGQTDKLFQQELRLTYAAPSGLTIIGGASYANLDRTAFIGEWVDSVLGYTLTLNIPTVPRDFSRALLERADYLGTFQDVSAFIDATVPIGEKITLTGGVRYARNEKEFSNFVREPTTIRENRGAPIFYLWPYYTSKPIVGSKEWDNTSFRAALNYDLTETVTLYGAFNQGWKPGGFSTLQVAKPPPPYTYTPASDAFAFGSTLQEVKPEESNSFELGMRGSALSRVLGFSVAVYRYDYSGLQRIRIVNAQTFVENIDAEGQGVEGNFQLRPNRNFDAYVNFAYNDTSIKDDPVVAANIGKPLNRAPKWNGTIGLNAMTNPIEALRGGTLFFGASANYRDDFRTDDQLVNNVPSYWLTNLNFGWESADGAAKLNVYARNVGNKFTFGRYLPPNILLSPLGSRSVIGSPRSIGADLTFRF